jgi:LysM repeat protein
MKFIIINSLILISGTLFGQKMTREQYVNKYYQLAVEEMNQYRIPASITLAQGILETENGNSDLCIKAKNHFGIKCQVTWTGMKFIKDDDTKNECFRAYSSAEESFRDHSTFLLRSRYEKLFAFEMTDYRSWAYGLKEAGYATNPNYPLMLIKHIEDLKLYQFDNYGNEATVGDVMSNNQIEKSITSVVSVEEEQAKLKFRKEKANNLDFIIIDSNFNIYELSTQKNIPIKNLMLYNDVENEQTISIGQNFFLQPKKSKNNAGVHEVKPGQSIYDIAQIYGVKVHDIRMHNKLELWEQPSVGEQLFLNTTRENFMKTRPFYELIKEKNKYNQLLHEAQVKLSNNTNVSPYKNIEVQIENPIQNPTQNPIPIQNPTQKLTIENSNEPQWITYKVKPKETLFKISKTYGCNPSDILTWNSLSLESGLSVGQVLKIQTMYPLGIINTPIVPVSNPVEQAKTTKTKVEVRYENGIKIKRKVAMTELYQSMPLKDSIK